MVPIGGRPLIEHTLAWLKQYGNAEVGINLHYLCQKIIACLGDGSLFGLKITYSYEDSLLGTAGGVKHLASLMKIENTNTPLILNLSKDLSSGFAHRSSTVGSFLVVYGDILTDMDLGWMLEHHIRSGALATIALFTVPHPHEVGIVEVDTQGRILSFTEKPVPGTEKSNLASGGIYILEPEVLDYIPPPVPPTSVSIFSPPSFARAAPSTAISFHRPTIFSMSAAWKNTGRLMKTIPNSRIAMSLSHYSYLVGGRVNNG
jgi:mannose-1-phosphate guanylyltransferase